MNVLFRTMKEKVYLGAVSHQFREEDRLLHLVSHLQLESPDSRVVHLDVEVSSEELLRQLSYAIKNQLVASKAPY